MKGSTEPYCNIFTLTFQIVRDVISGRECLISPVVRFHTVESLGDQMPCGYRYKVMIPHCLPRKHDPSSIKVRYGNIYKGILSEIQLGKPQEGFKPFYEVIDKSITVYVDHFCDLVCTSTQKNLYLQSPSPALWVNKDILHRLRWTNKRQSENLPVQYPLQ